MLQNKRPGANIEQVLDESSRWQEDVGFIVMFRFDYDATGYGRSMTAEPKPPEQMALRGADKPTLWWWSFLLLVSAGNLVLWVVIAREVHGLSDGYVAQQLLLLASSRPPARFDLCSRGSISSGNASGIPPCRQSSWAGASRR
jgi:hypothetical protein